MSSQEVNQLAQSVDNLAVAPKVKKPRKPRAKKTVEPATNATATPISLPEAKVEPKPQPKPEVAHVAADSNQAVVKPARILLTSDSNSFYCTRCKQRQEVKDKKQVMSSNQRPMIKAVCSVCSGNISSFIKASAPKA